MCLAQGDDMVDTLATDRSDQPFDEAVLPRRAWGNRLVTDAHGPYSLRGSGTVDTVPIADQVARSLTPRECLCDPCDPFRRRVWCDVDLDKVPARQPDDDEDVEQVKANGWNNEQVHGRDSRCMAAQEDEPPLRGRSTSLYHVLDNVGLSDFKAELEQRAMDARRALQRIVHAHPSDQHPQVCVDFRPASQGV